MSIAAKRLLFLFSLSFGFHRTRSTASADESSFVWFLLGFYDRQPEERLGHAERATAAKWHSSSCLPPFLPSLHPAASAPSCQRRLTADNAAPVTIHIEALKAPRREERRQGCIRTHRCLMTYIHMHITDVLLFFCAHYFLFTSFLIKTAALKTKPHPSVPALPHLLPRTATS
jgi:hypothetical protein